MSAHTQEQKSNELLVCGCDEHWPGQGHHPDCPVLERLNSLQKERDEADRRAGSAERFLEYERDTTYRRNIWLDKAKREWGVHTNASFDVVWEDCLKLKAACAGLEDPAEALRVAREALENCREDSAELLAEKHWWKDEPRCGYAERYKAIKANIHAADTALALLTPKA